MNRIALRKEKLRQNFKSDDLEGLLVSSATNVAYLTGFTGDSSVLVVSRERDLLISDGRFTTQIEQECLGLEAAILSVADFQTIREAMAGVTLVPTTDRVELLRQIKDEHEIEAIREAIAFAEKAFQMLRPELREGASEKEIADLLEANLRRCGATGSS